MEEKKQNKKLEGFGAEFSDDGKHRYSLWRIWDNKLPLVMFIGLNPSTANATEDDRTIQSVTRISESNGYGGFFMMNCWSYISTDPKQLVDLNNSESMLKLKEVGDKCWDVVFAWGNFKIVKDHLIDKKLSEMFPYAKCIKKNSNGSPAHPLFQKSNSKFISWK